MSELRLRPAARAILLDHDDRVLLVCFDFGDRVVWATPGGGIDDGETTSSARPRSSPLPTSPGRSSEPRV
jgi:ADP-ribose pyrophosphatase YjhB (NUDIX family)